MGSHQPEIGIIPLASNEGVIPFRAMTTTNVFAFHFIMQTDNVTSSGITRLMEECFPR